MPTTEILKKLSLPTLKSEVRKTNIKNWSALRKPALIELMLKPEHIQRFSHLGTKESKKKYIIPSRRVPLPTISAKDISDLGKGKVVKKKTIIRKPKTSTTVRRINVVDEEEPQKKVIIKSIKPSVAKKISVVAKTPSKAKVIAPKAKRIPMTATVIPAVIKKKIIKKLAKTPGSKLTGLTPAQMNAMTPEELFGKLPVALAKKVLDPKTTGVKVGAMNIKSIQYQDVFNDNKHMYDPEDEDSNYIDSMNYNDDFTDVLTPKQSRWYVKYRSEEDLSEKQEDIKESLQQKILSGVSNILGNQRDKIFKKWKKANKGMTGNLEDFKKSFGEFYDKEMGN
jgi:hypothetical protein